MDRKETEHNCLKDFEYIYDVFRETGRPRLILSKFRPGKAKQNYLYWIVLFSFLLSFGLIFYIFKNHTDNNILYPITLLIFIIHIYIFEKIVSHDHMCEYKKFGIERYSALKRSEYLHYIHFKEKIISGTNLDKNDINRLVDWITAEDNSKFSSVYESPLFLTALGGFITLIATSLAMIEVDTKKFAFGLIVTFAFFLMFLPFVDVVRTAKNKPLNIRKFLEWLTLDSPDITSDPENNGVIISRHDSKNDSSTTSHNPDEVQKLPVLTENSL